MDRNLSKRVKTIMAESWNLSVESIPDDAQLNKFAKWDSLSHVQVLLALQSKEGLVLSAELVQSLNSLPKIIEHLAGNIEHE